MVTVENLTEELDKYLGSTLFLLYDGVNFETKKKQCRYEDIRISKWRHLAITTNCFMYIRQPQNNRPHWTHPFKRLKNVIL